jgi:hypothetical protein
MPNRLLGRQAPFYVGIYGDAFLYAKQYKAPGAPTGFSGLEQTPAARSLSTAYSQ